MKQPIDVCLSPELLHLYDITESIVVVTDILRATTCMTAGLASGVASIVPVATLDECRALQQQGYVAGAERDGKPVAGFDMGNSPFSYMDEAIKGRQVAMTTSNGTLAITKSKQAAQVVIGAFINISAVAQYLRSQGKPVLVLCAGWKGKFNLEDTLFAGALVQALADAYAPACDSVLAARHLYQAAKADLLRFLAESSHVQRLKRLNIQKDVEFCLTTDVVQAIPVLKDDRLVLLAN